MELLEDREETKAPVPGTDVTEEVKIEHVQPPKDSKPVVKEDHVDEIKPASEEYEGEIAKEEAKSEVEVKGIEDYATELMEANHADQDEVNARYYENVDVVDEEVDIDDSSDVIFQIFGRGEGSIADATMTTLCDGTHGDGGDDIGVEDGNDGNGKNDDFDINGNISNNSNFVAASEGVDLSQTTCDKSLFKKVQAILKPMEQHLDWVLRAFNRMYLSLMRITENTSTQDLYEDFLSTLTAPSYPRPLPPMDTITTEEVEDGVDVEDGLMSNADNVLRIPSPYGNNKGTHDSAAIGKDGRRSNIVVAAALLLH